ncbi:hypothetical protein EV174_004181, partial [Coemansia sp. RSA 2320]
SLTLRSACMLTLLATRCSFRENTVAPSPCRVPLGNTFRRRRCARPRARPWPRCLRNTWQGTCRTAWPASLPKTFLSRGTPTTATVPRCLSSPTASSRLSCLLSNH